MLTLAAILSCAVLAPLPYWIVGRAALLAVGDDRSRLALGALLGAFILGYGAELSLPLGTSPLVIQLTVIILAGLYLITRRVSFISHAFFVFYLAYSVCLAVVLCTPYPGLGHWSGDWLENFKMAEALLSTHYPIELIQRTPLFAGSLLPLTLFISGLEPFLIGSAVLSSAAAMVFYYGLCEVLQRPPSFKTLLIFVLSSLCLLHLAAFWPKHLSAAALLACTIEIYLYQRHEDRRHFWWATFWLGGSVAAHHSGLLGVPLALALFLISRPFQWKRVVRDLTAFLVVGILCVGLFEVWSIASFGWNERINRNPTVLYRTQTSWVLYRLVFQSTFFGSDFSLKLLEKWNALGGDVIRRLPPIGYYLFTALITLSASTILGVFLFPLALTARKFLRSLGEHLRTGSGQLIAGVVLLILLGHAALVVQPTFLGCLQVGLTGLAFWGFFWVLVFLEQSSDTTLIPRTLKIVVWFQALPLLAMHLIPLFIINVNSPWRENLLRALTVGDADYSSTAALGLQGPGTPLFPLNLLYLAALLFVYRLATLRTKNPATTQAGYDPEFYQTIARVEDTHFWFVARRKLLLKALHRFFPDSKSFLEVGCGTGKNLSAISTETDISELVGIESESASLPHLQANIPQIPVHLGTVDEVNLNRSFDVVGAFDVIEHIAKDSDALAKIYSLVKPGGGVILTVPQHGWLWSEVDVKAHHVRRYERLELIQKLEASGFEVTWHTSFNAILLPLLLLSRLVGTGNQESEFTLGRLKNGIGRTCMKIEKFIIERLGISLPFGTSLLIVAHRR